MLQSSVLLSREIRETGDSSPPLAMVQSFSLLRRTSLAFTFLLLSRLDDCCCAPDGPYIPTVQKNRALRNAAAAFYASCGL